MKLKVLCSLAIAVAVGIASGQSSPYSLNVFPAQIFTATGQAGTPIQLNGLSSSTSTVGSSYTSGTITVTGTSLTTATFGLMGSADNGATYFLLPLYSVALPSAPPATTITVAANGLYQVNLAGLTHVKFVTSGVFTATNVSLTLTATPNGTVSRLGGGGTGGATIANTTALLKGVTGGNQGVAASYSDVAALFAGGSCTGFLKADGTCPTNAGASLPTNALAFGTGSFTSRAAVFGDIVPLWAGGSCTGFLKADGTCPTSVPSGAGGTDTQMQVNSGGALIGVTGFTYTGAAGLRIPNVMLANQPQNMWSATAYNSGGNTSGANGLATILANSSYLAQSSSTILLEPTYTEWDQSAMNLATGDRRSFLDLRQGAFNFVSLNAGPTNGAFGFTCTLSDNPGSTYGGSAPSPIKNCFSVNFSPDVPGYYYGFTPSAPNGAAFDTVLYSVNMNMNAAAINKSYLSLAYSNDAVGDTQVRDEQYFNNYGGGDKSADEGWHLLRAVETIGTDWTATLGAVTDFPSQGYKQLWMSVVHSANLGVGRWLMDSSTATGDTITGISTGDGSGDVTLTMTGSSYPVSTLVGLTANITVSSTNFYQTKTAQTFTVSTTTDLSVSNPLTPTPPAFQFVGDSSAECAQVQSYGTYNSGAHTQTITALLSDGHLAGAKIYIGGMACHGMTIDADVNSNTNNVHSMFYVFGSAANNQLIAGRLEQASVTGAFIVGGPVHIYQAARVLDVRPVVGSGDDNFVKVEETGATWNIGDTLISGLMATALNDTYHYAMVDNSPYSQGAFYYLAVGGSTMGGIVARDFWYINNLTPNGAYTWGGVGGKFTMGSLFHLVGPAPGIFNIDQPLRGAFLTENTCGYHFADSVNSFIRNICSGDGGQPGWNIQGDTQFLDVFSGATMASFASATGIKLNRNTVVQGTASSPSLIVNATSGLGTNDTLVVNGTSTFNGNITLSSGKFQGNIVSGSINQPGVIDCTAGYDHLGFLGCNANAISAPSFVAAPSGGGLAYLINNNPGGQAIAGLYNTSGRFDIYATSNAIGLEVASEGDIWMDARETVGGSVGGVNLISGVLTGGYSSGGPSKGLKLMASPNNFGTGPSNPAPFEIDVDDTAAVAHQQIFYSTSVTTAGAKANVLIAGNGGITSFGGPLQLKSYTVATLPASPAAGQTAYVTDAASPSFLGTVTGGGSTLSPVIYNGSAWVAF